MTRDLKFFYFGNQCPHNCYLLARIKTFSFQERIKLHLFDLSEDPGPAEKYKVFSPTMLLVNDEFRWHGPFSKEQVAAMLEGEMDPTCSVVRQSEDVIRGELVTLDTKTVLSTSGTCAGADDQGLCMGKSAWVSQVMKSRSLPHLGYLHVHRGRCVGGAEYLPSELVPYPIPDKRPENAYLTCSYMSDEAKDFRTHPLEGLIKDLRTWGFRSLSVAASKDMVFPNGPIWWFEKKGFVDKGLLVNEDLQNAEIHYLQLGL